MKFTRLFLLAVALSFGIPAADLPEFKYLLLATTKTSTMEKEMNHAADRGYIFADVMGGETTFGGNEAVVVMTMDPSQERSREYRLLATRKTSTLQKELREAGAAGFQYRGQTIFESTFGGEEVCVILERDTQSPARRIEYKLLATNKTSTMQKELRQAGEAGFKLLGMGVGETSFGGNEVVCILKKEASEQPSVE